MSERLCHTVTQQCSNHMLSSSPYTGFIKFSTFLVEKVARWKEMAAQSQCNVVGGHLSLIHI